MTLCKLLVLLLAIYSLLLAISVSNAQSPLVNIQKKITLTSKIFKLELESTKNDLLTIINDLEQRMGINEITDHLKQFQSNIKQVFNDYQLTQIDTSMSNELTHINNIQYIVMTASEGLKIALNELTSTISDFDLLSSDNINDINNNLKSKFQNAFMILFAFHTMINEKLVDLVFVEAMKFDEIMNVTRHAFEHDDTQTSSQILQNKIIALNDLVTIQYSFNQLMNSIRPSMFNFMSTTMETYSGLLDSIIPLFSEILIQTNQCPDCLNTVIDTKSDDLSLQSNKFL
ncbi:hypothetical protein I4U23_000317 [Adineta vaga]|nr:hypothetical protein I4U23_000317 [Adineta vaga]